MRRITLLLSLVFATLAAASARAVTWSWNVGTLDATTNSGWSVASDIGPSGALRWAYWTPSAGITVGGAGWAPSPFPGPEAAHPVLPGEALAQPAHAELLITDRVALATDATDRPWIAHARTNANCSGCVVPVRVSWRDSTTWTTQDVGLGYDSGPIDVSPDGHVHITYPIASGKTVRAVRSPSGTWSSDTLDMNVGALRVDGSNYPHVAGSGPGLRYGAFLPESWYPPAWQFATVDPSANPNGVSLALSAAGEGRIAWFNNTGDANAGLWYAEEHGGVWTREQVVAGANTGGWPALALDPAGDPMIAFTDYAGPALRVAHRKHGTWWTSTVDATSKYAGGQPALAIDAAGTPYVIYKSTLALGTLIATGTGTANVAPDAPGAFALRQQGATPLRAGRALAFVVRSPRAGVVELQCVDVAGRVLAASGPRAVNAGETPLRWTAALSRPGLYFVRARLAGGPDAVTRVVLVP